MKIGLQNIQSHLNKTFSPNAIAKTTTIEKFTELKGSLKTKSEILFSVTTVLTVFALTLLIIGIVSLCDTTSLSTIIGYFNVGKYDDILSFVFANYLIRGFLILSASNFVTQIVCLILWREWSGEKLKQVFLGVYVIFFILLSKTVLWFSKGFGGVLLGISYGLSVALFGFKILIIGVVFTIPIGVLVACVIGIPSAILALVAILLIPLALLLTLLVVFIVGLYPMLLAFFIQQKREI